MTGRETEREGRSAGRTAVAAPAARLARAGFRADVMVVVMGGKGLKECGSGSGRIDEERGGLREPRRRAVGLALRRVSGGDGTPRSPPTAPAVAVAAGVSARRFAEQSRFAFARRHHGAVCARLRSLGAGRFLPRPPSLTGSGRVATLPAQRGGRSLAALALGPAQREMPLAKPPGGFVVSPDLRPAHASRMSFRRGWSRARAGSVSGPDYWRWERTSVFGSVSRKEGFCCLGNKKPTSGGKWASKTVENCFAVKPLPGTSRCRRDDWSLRIS